MSKCTICLGFLFCLVILFLVPHSVAWGVKQNKTKLNNIKKRRKEREEEERRGGRGIRDDENEGIGRSLNLLYFYYYYYYFFRGGG